MTSKPQTSTPAQAARRRGASKPGAEAARHHGASKPGAVGQDTALREYRRHVVIQLVKKAGGKPTSADFLVLLKVFQPTIVDALAMPKLNVVVIHLNNRNRSIEEALTVLNAPLTKKKAGIRLRNATRGSDCWSRARTTLYSHNNGLCPR